MIGLQGSLSRSRWRAGLLVGAVAALVAGLGVATANSANAAAGCRVSYVDAGQWPGGFTASVTVTNLGDRIDGWRLGWTFPSGQTVSHAWNATVTASGAQVTAAGVSHNAVLATNASASFGFNGSWTGSNAAPAAFTLNGVACTGGVGQPSTSPSAPGPGPSASSSPSTPPPAGNAAAAVAAMQPGWNLGNSLDATGADETSWGNPRVTEALLDGIKAQGFKSIRIPVTWGQHQGGAPDHPIEAAYLDRVKEVVGWAPSWSWRA